MQLDFLRTFECDNCEFHTTDLARSRIHQKAIISEQPNEIPVQLKNTFEIRFTKLKDDRRNYLASDDSAGSG